MLGTRFSYVLREGLRQFGHDVQSLDESYDFPMSFDRDGRLAVGISRVRDFSPQDVAFVRAICISSIERCGSMQLKSLLETVQSFVTIVGIIVGGFWTYVIFIRERRAFPHANIEQRLSHVALSKRANLLHVNVELSNLGTSRLVSKKCIVRVQQILPTVPCTAGASCAIDEVDQALKETGQKQDHFTWPLIAEREGEPDPPIDVEPGETDSIEYEFALPATVEVVRVYSYYRNDRRTEGDTEIGWSASTYYTLR